MTDYSTPSVTTRVYDAAGNCLDPGCDGSVQRPCVAGDQHRSFWVDWDADPTGHTICETWR